MKLKNVLILAFFTLTIIPIVFVSGLLYKSGFSLSKESYTRNLVESINVQVDYVSQTIENNMISDYRFANRLYAQGFYTEAGDDSSHNNLLQAFQAYLESSEDKITVCMLLDKNSAPVYTIGEKATIDAIKKQLPTLQDLKKQSIVEFVLEDDTYSLGIITPIIDTDGVYSGSLISIYDKSYLFKIISSYYKIADTSTYICQSNGGIINFRGLSDDAKNAAVQKALANISFDKESAISTNIDNIGLSGYYKNISNTPWYLVGFLDDSLIYDFTNQFLWIYMLIIAGVVIVGAILSVGFSQKVVEPINGLIKVMDGYQSSLNSNELQFHGKNSYYETQYLSTKFLELMRKILLVQHNFEGVYQLYQSSDMGDINIDIDTIKQTAQSNKSTFQGLMDKLVLPQDACIVDSFIGCFCEKDQSVLRDMFESMRDEHLSIAREAELYTPHMEGGRWFHTLVVPMYENDRLCRLFVQLRDISSFKKQEIASTEKAMRDSLTGLYNRSGFAALITQMLQDIKEPALHALLFIDMDYFKMVNDNFGHSSGDDLLCQVAKAIQGVIGPGGIVSRFGGDEFAVFLPNTSIKDIDNAKDELTQCLIYSFQKENTAPFTVSASIGTSVWNNSSNDTLDELLQKADANMYTSKRNFKENGKR